MIKAAKPKFNKKGLDLHGFEMTEMSMWPHRYNERNIPFQILTKDLVVFPKKPQKKAPNNSKRALTVME